MKETTLLILTAVEMVLGLPWAENNVKIRKTSISTGQWDRMSSHLEGEIFVPLGAHLKGFIEYTYLCPIFTLSM